MRLVRRPVAAVCLMLVAVLAAPAPPALAHDFGSLSINVYSRLTLEASQVRVRWVLDMAEIPAGAIVTLIDQDEDGSASAEEQDAYFATWLSSVLDQIHLTVGEAELPKRVEASRLELPIGENGARYLRVYLDLTAELPPAPGDEIFLATYRDANYAEYVGWREVVVTATRPVELLASTVAEVDRTNELQTYPPDLGAGTPNSDAEFSFRVGAGTGQPGASAGDGHGAQPATQADSAPNDDLLALGLLLLAVAAIVVSALSVLGSGARRRARRGASRQE
jgi:hypothetical protein